MPARTFDECKENTGDSFNKFLNPEFNFCAGHADGKSISLGDSGGALVYQRSDKFYARGIASLSVGDSGIIDSTKFSLFTDIQSHYKWITDNMDESEKDERWIVYTSCSALIDRIPLDSEIQSSYPWHAVIINDEEIAAGTIISDDIILTASSIATTNSTIQIKYQFFTVIDSETCEDSSISLLKLNKPITFYSSVEAACMTNVDFEYLDHPQWVPSFTMNNTQLIQTDVKVTKSKLVNYFGAGDSSKFINTGSGLVFKFPSGNYLRGMIKFPFISEGAVSFLDIVPHYDWIIDTIKKLH